MVASSFLELTLIGVVVALVFFTVQVLVARVRPEREARLLSEVILTLLGGTVLIAMSADLLLSGRGPKAVSVVIGLGGVGLLTMGAHSFRDLRAVRRRPIEPEELSES